MKVKKRYPQMKENRIFQQLPLKRIVKGRKIFRLKGNDNRGKLRTTGMKEE